jgi:ketol-acid reductoisomerase
VNILYPDDQDRQVLENQRIAMIGYGSQGRPQALNLRDSGLAVTVGLRPESPARSQAQADGLGVAPIGEVVRESQVVMLMIPDESQPSAYEREIRANLQPGAYLGFAHGFAIHFRKIVPDAQLNVFLVAPKGVGPMVRRRYLEGGGVPGLIAVHQDPGGQARAVALAYASALGCGRAGVLETTFREETETDLFGEQVVLCGGLIELIRAAFETLVDAGYAPEMAYFECLHEVKLIADLIHDHGLQGMREKISNTAEYGGLTRGPRVVGEPARAAMREILEEIRQGAFAEAWLAEHASGATRLLDSRRQLGDALIEVVGRRLREMASGEPTPSAD